MTTRSFISRSAGHASPPVEDDSGASRENIRPRRLMEEVVRDDAAMNSSLPPLFSPNAAAFHGDDARRATPITYISRHDFAYLYTRATD